MTTLAQIEIRDLHLPCTIGQYPVPSAAPDMHLLDLIVTIAPALVLVHADDMAQVFDYDPLLAQIDQIARAQDYVTQEHLLTRIAIACASHAQITAVDARLRKAPVQGGSVGLRLVLGQGALANLRAARRW